MMPNIDYAGMNADPTKIKQFMENNVVMPGQELSSAAIGSGVPEYVEFMEITVFPTGRIGLTNSGPSCKVYSLVRSKKTSANDALLCYICEYGDGTIKYVALDSQANFCFTCSMNGCTFGIGSKASDGTVLVSHANAKGLTSGFVTAEEKNVGHSLPRANKSHIQSEYQTTMIMGTYAANGFQGSVNLMSPSSYRLDDNTNATTVGYRTNGNWEFCFQSRRSESGVVALLGVFPVATNSLTLA